MKHKSMRLLPERSYFQGKRTIIRADLNVDIVADKIIDDFRIRRALSTIKEISPRARYTLLVSHRGSFECPNDYTETLEPVAKHLSRLLGRNVYFLEGSVESVRYALEKLPDHAIALLENIRWYKGERENSTKFAKQLAQLTDVFVNDAFGEIHRREASIVAITKFVPSFAGLLLQDELRHLDNLSTSPRRPFAVLMGGAKLYTKLPLIKRFLRIADAVLVGTALANTFIAAQGNRIGKSLQEKKFIFKAKAMLRNQSLIIPDDYVVSPRVLAGKGKVTRGSLSSNSYIVDIGPETAKTFSSLLEKAGTIFWNGPVGCFEHAPFANGSRAVAKAILGNTKAFKVIGGGDTLELLKPLLRRKPKVKNFFISTGGGAMVSYLAGIKLPGIEALKKQYERR
ncbi:MAG: Phosphoglycerate kinase [Parcubacteria group bacterium GW2011_GWB1_46_8]|nr:MAG: Phosphoglycerate kinase [Parcubacteria group bacterium GW2011_GWF1_45_5]KKU46647.1 MAG: Phosphoglycerate kinase [Parcubacteria group bacterium GW2011_GWB1_46_8]KKU47787.1 MAG: Phosphoglycerate kinase [Parcubacteria group bacterium GW2011_GWF2_46_8]